MFTDVEGKGEVNDVGTNDTKMSNNEAFLAFLSKTDVEDDEWNPNVLYISGKFYI